MIDAATRELVRQRAGNRCEYCLLPQDADEARFHVEHILAQQHAPPGIDEPDNLALACHRCNLHKGPNLSSVDPTTGDIIVLFHPRRDQWRAHFALQGAAITGLTPTGRATAQLLQFNARRRLEFREGLIAEGRFGV
ncbi:MAG: HNH endonuclease [Planctomycetes bacterium]|nr:HNH endonuclease [Planctomycetota bacterium]